MKQDLTGKIAVVTGAGGGIGRATAVRLAQEKMKIVLFGGNNLGKLDETRRLVEQQTVNGVVFVERAVCGNDG